MLQFIRKKNPTRSFVSSSRNGGVFRKGHKEANGEKLQTDFIARKKTKLKSM